jgi:hypothetical protein
MLGRGEAAIGSFAALSRVYFESPESHFENSLGSVSGLRQTKSSHTYTVV